MKRRTFLKSGCALLLANMACDNSQSSANHGLRKSLRLCWLDRQTDGDLEE
jgi:hypothetical protein